MSGDEDQFAITRALGIPLQEIFAINGLAIFVDAEQRHIQVVARISEIVRIAAVKSSLLFHGKDQTDVGVLLVAVEPILAAGVESDHIRAEAGFVGALALDVGDDGLALGEFFFRVLGGLYRGVDAVRDILGGNEDIDFQVRRLHFLFGLGGVEAVADVIMFGAGIFLELAESNVVVGEQ